MAKLVLISSEPDFAEMLRSELAQHEVLVIRDVEGMKTFAEDAALLIVDKASIAEIPPTVTVPYVTITKPVRLSELLYTIEERLQAQTRKFQEDTLVIGNCQLSLRERILRNAAGDMAELTEKEVELLNAIVKNEYITKSKDELLKQVWGYADGTDTHTLETHIYRLRGKLKQLKATSDIALADGAGYIILHQE